MLIFFKGLPQSVDDEALRKLFSPFGILKDVRLATFRNGFSKGIAYIEYEDDVSLQLQYWLFTHIIRVTDGLTFVTSRPVRVLLWRRWTTRKLKGNRFSLLLATHRRRGIPRIFPVICCKIFFLLNLQCFVCNQTTVTINVVWFCCSFLQRRPPTAFVPRSLQVHKTDTESTSNGSEPKKPMTNEDFKKLLALKRPAQ